MEYTRDGDNLNTGESGNFGTGLALGSILNRRDDDRNSQWIWAVIIFIIFVVIALVFLAFMRKDERREVVGGDYAGLLATITAAKCADGNNYKGYDHDHIEIKDLISHSEDRRLIEKNNSEIGALGLLLQKTAADNEMANLKEFGEIKGQLGALSMGMTQVLQVQNNNAIVTDVINRLMCMPKVC